MNRIFVSLYCMCVFFTIWIFFGCESTTQAEPQIAIERSGEKFRPLSIDAKVSLYVRDEPQKSFREIGKITSTCPEKHWVRGRHVKGRPVCLVGLRQGARKIGAQAVIEIKTKRFRPSWDPENPWLIMNGIAIRLRQ